MPALVKAGHGSVKVFMTYDRLRVDDEQMLDVMLAARDRPARWSASTPRTTA